jgi:hypothetical protein
MSFGNPSGHYKRIPVRDREGRARIMSSLHTPTSLAEALHDVRCMAAGCHADTVPRLRSCWEWKQGRYVREAEAILAELPAVRESVPSSAMLLGV